MTEAEPYITSCQSRFRKLARRLLADLSRVIRPCCADIDWHTSRRSEALVDLHRAMDLAEQQRAQASGGEQERATAFAESSYLYERMLDWQMELHDVARQQRLPNVAEPAHWPIRSRLALKWICSPVFPKLKLLTLRQADQDVTSPCARTGKAHTWNCWARTSRSAPPARATREET